MKVALVTGINKYKDDANNLQGCVRDANNIFNILSTIYKFDDINIFVDDQVKVDTLPNYLKNSISLLSDGDEFVWYHSGHGTQVPDLHSDETDATDEALVLHDSDWTSMYTDDLMCSSFANFPKNAYCTLIFDTCFSGGMYKSKRKLRTVNPPKDLFKNYKSRKIVKKIGEQLPVNSIVFCACQENQYSEEILFNNEVEGAFTHYFMQCLDKNKLYYKNNELCQKISSMLKKNQLSQSPLIFGNEKMKDRIFLGIEKQNFLRDLFSWFLDLFK